MQTVDEKPETIHLYVVREETPKPPVFPVLLSALTLSLLLIYCVLAPYRQPELRVVIRVPAVFLPLQTLVTSVKIVPTGKKTYPATFGWGILTLTNGSVISQTLPAGLIFTGNQGNTQVITDFPVFVPAGSASGFGFATVQAHALISGRSGNIPALSIDRVEGTSVYIRNLTSFQGGQDSYTVTLQLPIDRQTALGEARSILGENLGQSKAILAYPCKEVISGVVQLVVQWACQFYSYSVSPTVQVTRVKLSGKTVIVDGFIVERPIFTGK
jgi:hypothetical protein